MKLLRFAILTLTMSVFTAHADPVVTIFGLPLGGKPSFPMEMCSEKAAANKTICWTEKPLLQAVGNQTGSIKFYSTDSLPIWAAYAKFWMNIATPGNDVSSVGSIQELEVSDVVDGVEVIKSISSRFGKPTSKTTKGSSDAYWILKDISISVRCTSKCTVTFVSANLANARQRTLDSREANRPTTP